MIEPPRPEATRSAHSAGIATIGFAPNKNGRMMMIIKLPVTAGSTPTMIETIVATKTARRASGWNMLLIASIKAGIVSMSTSLKKGKCVKGDQFRLEGPFDELGATSSEALSVFSNRKYGT